MMMTYQTEAPESQLSRALSRLPADAPNGVRWMLEDLRRASEAAARAARESAAVTAERERERARSLARCLDYALLQKSAYWLEQFADKPERISLDADSILVIDFDLSPVGLWPIRAELVARSAKPAPVELWPWIVTGYDVVTDSGKHARQTLEAAVELAATRGDSPESEAR